MGLKRTTKCSHSGCGLKARLSVITRGGGIFYRCTAGHATQSTDREVFGRLPLSVRRLVPGAMLIRLNIKSGKVFGEYKNTTTENTKTCRVELSLA